jgi:hypothetical protein
LLGGRHPISLLAASGELRVEVTPGLGADRAAFTGRV